MKENAALLVKYMRKQLKAGAFHLKHKTSKRHFVRKSPLGFKNTAAIILRMVKKSTKAEVMMCFNEIDKEAEVPSRQAFSQAREKISYLAFKDFFDKSCELTVNSQTARLWRGYRLFGIDGTSFFVGKMEKLAEYFGSSTTVPGKAMCRISAVVDIANDCIANAIVSPLSVGERALALEQIEQLRNVANALYLLDRGYWSPKLVEKIVNNRQKFVMRLASNAGKTIVADENHEHYQLRKYSFTLPSGETEILLTNLPLHLTNKGDI